MNNWFIKNLIVAPFPTVKEVDEIKNIDVIINCWDWYFHSEDIKQDYIRFSTNKNIEKHFCPINPKLSDTLDALDKLIDLLYSKELENKVVMIHCRSGLHRSVATVNAYHYFRFKKHQTYNNKHNMLLENCKEKYNMFPLTIPEMEIFLINKRKQHNLES